MNETWNISLVGITFALGGLGLIAAFFAIVGHFFKKNAEQKKISKSASSLTITDKGKDIQEKNNKTIQYTVERGENIEEEEEIVAAISAAIMTYAPAGGKIVSINRVNDEKKGTKNLWRLHNAQTVWRIKKARKGQ